MSSEPSQGEPVEVNSPGGGVEEERSDRSHAAEDSVGAGPCCPDLIEVLPGFPFRYATRWPGR
eukprot:2059706-Lingulodinium_polyedra.AAC.1